MSITAEDRLLEQRKRDAFRLAGETGIDPRTARRWLRGQSVQRATELALEAAAAKLKIELTGAQREAS